MQQWELAGFEGKSDTKHPLRFTSATRTTLLIQNSSRFSPRIEGWNPLRSCLPLLHERSLNSLFSVRETNARTLCPSRSRPPLSESNPSSVLPPAARRPKPALPLWSPNFHTQEEPRSRFPSPIACLNPGWPFLCTGLRTSMDLETENHLAALLVEEARRLRREAEKDGVHVYLQKPNVRGRPNSRFLTATVLGVEQANRAAEISEMWRAREKERELDAKQRHGSKDNRTGMHLRDGCLHENSKPWLEENSALVTSLDKCRKINSPSGGSQSRHENDQRDHSRHCSSSKRYSDESHSRGFAGLHDDDIEEFLHSRVKRGRGSVGCRMDEPGPYLPSTSADLDEHSASSAKRAGEERKPRILGPEKPYFLKSNPARIGFGFSMRQTTDECKSEKDSYEEKRKSKREKSESKRRKEKEKNQKKHRRRDTVKLKAKYM